jgi:hypothetical protein
LQGAFSIKNSLCKDACSIRKPLYQELVAGAFTGPQETPTILPLAREAGKNERRKNTRGTPKQTQKAVQKRTLPKHSKQTKPQNTKTFKKTCDFRKTNKIWAECLQPPTPKNTARHLLLKSLFLCFCFLKIEWFLKVFRFWCLVGLECLGRHLLLKSLFFVFWENRMVVEGFQVFVFGWFGMFGKTPFVEICVFCLFGKSHVC